MYILVYTMEEKIIRKVTGIGNGAHVFAPKEWINDEVQIMRVKKNPKEELIKIIYPHLDKITAAFLYGSYARNEQEVGSDLDFFIISNEKFSIKSKNSDIIVVPEDKIEAAKKLNPILFYSMLQEAKSVINQSYLEKLKKEEINFDYFNYFISETKRWIEINKSSIELNKLNNEESDESTIYSLILRLRGVFIINSLLRKEKYSKKGFENFITQNSKANYKQVYAAYRIIRDNQKQEKKINLEQAESLLDLLIREIEILEKKI